MLVIDQGSKKTAATPKKAPAAPPPPQKPTPTPALTSEHGQGSGSSSSDTGEKPTAWETRTGYATPSAVQPKPTTPKRLTDQGHGSSSGGSGAAPIRPKPQTGHATSPAKGSSKTASASKGSSAAGAQTTTLQPKKAASHIPKPEVTIKATKEMKPIVKTVPIGEWGVVKFESSASASVSFSSRDAHGRSAAVEFDPNGLVSVSGGSQAFGNFAFTDKGTLSAEVSRFQDPGELLATDFGTKKTKKNQLRLPVSTKADKTITVGIGNQWMKVEPKPTEYHIHAIVEDGHVGFEFSAARELEIKDSRGIPASVEYEATTKMTFLETKVPGRPSRFPERIPLEEALKILQDAGLGVLIIGALGRFIRSQRGEGDDGGGDPAGDVVLDG